MENAADALKMAGDVLLFVLAISVAIFSFGQVRETADNLLNSKDRETEYIVTNYYYDASDNYLTRQVGLETILPSIYRAFLENYKIVFEGSEFSRNNQNKCIYKQVLTDTSTIPIFDIDLETSHSTKNGNGTSNNNEIWNAALGNNNDKIAFLNGILYGNYTLPNVNQTNGEVTFDAVSKEKFQDTYNIRIENDPLYKRLNMVIQSGKIIEEKLGVYYQTDSEEEPEVNKVQKRIITYIIK